MLEIVITGRHDDYGGADFQDRLCAAAEHNHRLLSEAGVEHRFTLVEWNPIDGRALLADIVRARLPWWHRALVVDREWHQALSTNPRLEFMEFFAKNAAIRRSDADAILTTNTDVFFSTEVVASLAALKPADRVVYRAMRIDIDRCAPWRDGEGVFADAAHQLRVNDVQPPTYGNSAGDFLLLTRAGWEALGGFNERVRFAKIHKDGQFCVHAHEQGFAFEVLGPIYHIDHDGSYANAGAMRGSPDAPYGPEWEYRCGYRNAASWGLTSGIDDEPEPGLTFVHHPDTHGPLLSIICDSLAGARAGAGLQLTHRHEREVEIVLLGGGTSRVASINAALAQTTGRFVVVADPRLGAFGGRDAMLATLRVAERGLVVPSGTLCEHPSLGKLPVVATPVAIGRDVLDALSDFDEAEPQPELAFWLQAAELGRVTEMAGPSTPAIGNLPDVRPELELKTLARRGAELSSAFLVDAIRYRVSAGSDSAQAIGLWVEASVPDSTAPCAVIGPDWATAGLLDALHASGRDVVGLFTASVQEEGTCRWGEPLRPLSELVDEGVAYVVAGSSQNLAARLAAIGSRAIVYAIGVEANHDAPSAEAEVDALRRWQASDLSRSRVDRVLNRLPVLSALEGDNRFGHWYAAAQECEKAGRTGDALRLFREVMAECLPDLALRMRATFHVARLLAEAGERQQALPLLKGVLLHNPGHGAARRMVDAIAEQQALTQVAV